MSAEETLREANAKFKEALSFVADELMFIFFPDEFKDTNQDDWTIKEDWRTVRGDDYDWTALDQKRLKDEDLSLEEYSDGESYETYDSDGTENTRTRSKASRALRALNMAKVSRSSSESDDDNYTGKGVEESKEEMKYIPEEVNEESEVPEEELKEVAEVVVESRSLFESEDEESDKEEGVKKVEKVDNEVEGTFEVNTETPEVTDEERKPGHIEEPAAEESSSEERSPEAEGTVLEEENKPESQHGSEIASVHSETSSALLRRVLETEFAAKNATEKSNQTEKEEPEFDDSREVESEIEVFEVFEVEETSSALRRRVLETEFAAENARENSNQTEKEEPEFDDSREVESEIEVFEVEEVRQEVIDLCETQEVFDLSGSGHGVTDLGKVKSVQRMERLRVTRQKLRSEREKWEAQFEDNAQVKRFIKNVKDKRKNSEDLDGTTFERGSQKKKMQIQMVKEEDEIRMKIEALARTLSEESTREKNLNSEEAIIQYHGHEIQKKIQHLSKTLDQIMIRKLNGEFPETEETREMENEIRANILECQRWWHSSSVSAVVVDSRQGPAC